MSSLAMSKINFTSNSLSTISEFQKNDFLYLKNQKPIKYYKLVEGLLFVGDISKKNEPFFSHFIQPEDFFGEEIILRLNKRLNYVKVFSKTALVEEFIYCPEFNIKNNLNFESVLQSCIQRVYKTNYTLFNNTHLQLRTRILYILNFFANHLGEKLINNEFVINIHLKHKELAFLTNSARQSISSELNKLTTDGWIKIDRSRVLLSEKFVKTFALSN
jgi:CRP-like cAMP-binding protein